MYKTVTGTPNEKSLLRILRIIMQTVLEISNRILSFDVTRTAYKIKENIAGGGGTDSKVIT